jgi:hypothetical protein
MELLRDENAPFDVLVKFRDYVDNNRHFEFILPDYQTGKKQAPVNDTIKGRILHEVYEALNCKWCLSIWCGLFVALCTRQNLIYTFAYSAGALFLSPIFKAVIQDEISISEIAQKIMTGVKYG